MKRIAVYCGSNAGRGGVYLGAARAFGRALAERGLGLVYGGGRVGLMGAVADAALAAGGEVVGVIPDGLARRELAHRGLSDLRVVSTMHERKALMAELSDAFVALPGGLGTLDELCEVLTWSQLGLHSKPCGVLDVDGYFERFFGFLDHAVERGFVSGARRRAIARRQDARGLLDELSRRAARGRAATKRRSRE